MRTCRSYFPSLALAVVALAMMGLASAYGASLFVVDGAVSEPDGTPVAGLTVAVENLSKPTLSTYESEPTSEEGAYGVTMVRDFITSVSDEGDQLLVQAIDTSGAVDVVRGQVLHTITAVEEAEQFGATVDITLSGVIVQFDEASILGDGASSATLTVEVTDREGNAVEGDTLTAVADDGTVGDFADLGAGTYEATFDGPVSSETMSVSVTVTSTLVEDASGLASIVVEGVPSGITVASADAALTADGEATTMVTATLERNSIPITDEVVEMSVLEDNGSVGDVTNNGDGTYSATYTAGTLAGVAIIQVTATGSGDVNVGSVTLNPGEPVAISSVVATPAAISGNGIATSTVTATVVDAFDNPVPGLTGATASVTDGVGSAGDVADNGDGTYAAVYTSELVTEDGTATVEVAYDALAGDVVIDLSAEPAAETSVLAIQGSALLEGGGAQAPDGLTVTVTNVTREASLDSTTGAAGDGRYSVTFLDFLGGVVGSSGDLIRVTVTDAEGEERGSMDHHLLAAEVEASAATVDVETDIQASNNVVAVTGLATYEDGESPIAEIADATVRVQLNGSEDTADIGSAGVGRFSIGFVNIERPFVTGEDVEIEVSAGGEVVGSLMFEATSAQILSGLIDIGTLTTTLKASNVALGVTGSVVPEPGADPAPAGSIVRVTNLSKPTLAPVDSVIGAAGPDAFSVGFFALGDIVVESQDILLLEVIDPLGDVIGSGDAIASTSEVIAGAVSANVTLTGIVVDIEIDSPVLTLGANGAAQTVIVGQAVEADGTPTILPINFEPAEFFTAPEPLGNGRFSSTFSTSYANDGIVGPFTITVSAGTTTRRRLALDIVDDMAPTVDVSPVDPSVLAGHEFTLTAAVSDNTEVVSVAWDVNEDGSIDSVDTTLTATLMDLGAYPVSVTVTDVAGNETVIHSTVTATTVSVGGLAIDAPNFIRLIQKTLSTAIDSPDLDEETKSLIKALLPQLIRNGSLLGVAVPIFPATLDTPPTQPVLVEDPSGLDLENFGNPLFLSLLDAAGEDASGILDDSLRLPLAVVGENLNLYARTPSATDVTFNLISESGATIAASAQDVSASGVFDYTFAVGEELLLFVLPAWPGSGTNPLSSVTLRVSTDGQAGMYDSIPLTRGSVLSGGDEKFVWSSVESLDAGTAYHYYYEVEFSYPIHVGPELSSTTMYAIPDMRNLQFEDRGFPDSADPELRNPLLDTVALKIQPVVAGLLGQIEAEATRLAEDAILNDPALQQQIADDPAVRAAIENAVVTDPQVQSALLADPAVEAAIANHPATIALEAQITAEVIAELESDATVIAAGEAAAQAVLLGGGTQAEAAAAGEAAATAQAEALAPAIAEGRFEAAVPGLLNTVLPDIAGVAGPVVLPFIQDDIQPILLERFGPAFLGQALENVVGDPGALVAQVEDVLSEFGDKVSAEIAATGDVPLVSKFTVPAADGLWVATFDMASIDDGSYMVQVELDGSAVFANAKPILIDRSPGEVSDVDVAANAGAGLYTASDGTLVAAALDEAGTLQLSASVDGDGFGAMFQLLGMEDDPADQVQRVWVPVNQRAILVAAALREAGADGTESELYDTALVAVVLSDPELVATLETLDPEGVTQFIEGFAALSPAEQDEVFHLAQIVRGTVLDGDLFAASAALSLDFATLGQYATLVAELQTIPAFEGMAGSARMLFPSEGSYYLRALSADQYANINSQDVPQRLDIVEAEEDEFEVTAFAIGESSSDVGEDGTVVEDGFAIRPDTTSVEVTYEASDLTGHPLTGVSLEASTDGATWAEVASVPASELAGIAEGDSLAATYEADGAALVADGVEMVSFRVVASNALTVVGEGDVATLNVLDVVPAEIGGFVAEEGEGSTPSPDSGGFRGTVNLVTTTPVSTEPVIGGVRLDISIDGGGSYLPLDVLFGGPESGSVSESIAGAPGSVTWTAKWDTTIAGDTVTGDGPGARDASLDDNPYMVRAVLLDEAGAELSVEGTVIISDSATVAVDNVDDVAPMGTTITSLLREARVLGTFEEPTLNADGLPLLRAQAQVVANVIADPATITGGLLDLVAVDITGAVIPVAGAAIDDGETDYTLQFDTAAVENGVVGLAALITDAAGNQEVIESTVDAEIANILIGGLRPDDPAVLALLRIVSTGVLSTNRNLAQLAEDRPVGGTAVFELDAPGAELGDIFVSANLDDLSDAMLQEIDITTPPADAATGLFRFSVDTTAFADGVVYVRFVLGASPNVMVPAEPVMLIVDNTAPEIAVASPTAGAIAGTRPVVWTQYSDASGIAISGIRLSDVDGNPVFDGQVGGADERIALDESIPGLSVTGARAVYQAPNDARLTSGGYMVDANVIDLAGNPNAASSTFTVEPDTEHPNIVSYAPTGSTENPRPAVTVTFTDNLAGVNETGVVIAVQDAAGGVVPGALEMRTINGAPAVGATLLSGTVAFLPSISMGGEYTASAIIADTDGNATPATWQFTVVTPPPPPRDEDPPIVASTSPTGTVRSEDATLVVSFTDASPVVVARFDVDETGVQDADEIVDNRRARLAVSGLTQGQHSVVATLIDVENNATVVEWTFLVEIDIVPPEISAMAPTGYVGTLRPTISATMTDNLVGVDEDSIVVRLDGRSVTPTDADATHVLYEPREDLEPGAHRVEIEVADALGNDAVAEWEFTVETTPPSITAVVPAPGAKIGGNADARSAIVVSAFYNDTQSGVDDSSVEIAVTLDGVPVAGAAADAGATAVSWEPSGVLEAGVYDVALSLEDNVGNATEYAWSFVVEEEVALSHPPRIAPNPFADEVDVMIYLGQEAEVKVRIYDFTQRLVATVPTESLLPGRQRISLTDAFAPFGRGVYLVQIIVEAGDSQRVSKVLKAAKVR